jgi:hypothetical protein
MNNIASAMHSNLSVRENGFAETKKVQTIRKKYDDRTANILLLLTRSEDDADLPEYYLTITAKPTCLSE